MSIEDSAINLKIHMQKLELITKSNELRILGEFYEKKELLNL